MKETNVTQSQKPNSRKAKEILAKIKKDAVAYAATTRTKYDTPANRAKVKAEASKAGSWLARTVRTMVNEPPRRKRKAATRKVTKKRRTRK
jgi:hypothetical protein